MSRRHHPNDSRRRGNRLDTLAEEQNQARAEAAVQLLSHDVFGGIIMEALARGANDPDFLEMQAETDRVCQHVERMYKTTDATASQCVEYLMEHLPDGVEPDCVPLVQTFWQLADEEEAEEGKKPSDVPKAPGKDAGVRAEKPKKPSGKKTKAKKKRNNAKKK